MPLLQIIFSFISQKFDKTIVLTYNSTMFLGYIDPGTGFTIFGGIGGFLSAVLIPFFLAIGVFFKKFIASFFRRKKRAFVILIIALGIAAIIAGVIMKTSSAKFSKRIVILGMDGLSPEIMQPLMAAGKLPHFSALKAKGSFSLLATTNPSQSPVAWTGFATGKNPGKHGVADFIKRDPEKYSLELSTTQIRNNKVLSPKKSRSFWDYTSRLKIPAVIIGCPVTFPPERLFGRMLSGMGTPDILGTQGTFTFFTSEPLQDSKDVGGKVFHVTRSRTKLLNLLGPRMASVGGRPDNLKIPFKVTVDERASSITIDIQNQRCMLAAGRWSDWIAVTFNAGPFTKMRGILKFYLVETTPEFKLYVSPINFDPRRPNYPISYPSGYSKELADAIGLFYTQGMPCDTWAVNENRLTEDPFLEQVNEVSREVKAIFDHELDRFKKGILFCYFESSDIIQHMFWRYTDPRHPLYDEKGAKKYGNVITGWYQKMDSILGEVMDTIGDDDILIVLSDHGFNTFRRSVHVNTWLRRNGYLELTDPRAPLGRELLADIDWSRTRAYAIGFGSIYINQTGRESQGIVKPGEETEALKKELSEKLRTWQDEPYQLPIISSVYRKEEIFWGPFSDEMPDLYLGFAIGYRASWQTAMGAVPENLVEDNRKKWSGDHLFDPKLIPGVLFVNRPITKNDPSLYDITPTILKLVGVTDEALKKCDFDGAPLF